MTENEKRSRRPARVPLAFSPAMPCGTGGCMREATSGFVVYDPALLHWHFFPRCPECAEYSRQEQAQVNARSVLDNDVWHDE